MKKLLPTIALLMTLAPTAYAEDSKTMCKQVSAVAEQIMKARQNGVDMSKLFELTEDNEAAQGMIILAYEQPQYSSDKYQQREVQKFKNGFYLACVKNKMGATK